MAALMMAALLMAAQAVVMRLAQDAGYPVAAAQAQEEEKKQQETRRTPALRNAVYEQLAEAQTFIEAKQYAEGLEILKDMEAQKG
ncbi:MAG: hypothetical protein V2J89_14985, partial [Halieaceae bacterium]|nr:hypothetical protein [Halieaceae bacterium]